MEDTKVQEEYTFVIGRCKRPHWLIEAIDKLGQGRYEKKALAN
jgi:hypothetical protein